MRRFRLVKTCNACPEQYDVYFDGAAVGYMRLRHGNFRCDLLVSNATVYSTEAFRGDGMFAEEIERVKHLNAALRELDRVMDGTDPAAEEPLYDLEDRT